jgi:hypothetical protein
MRRLTVLVLAGLMIGSLTSCAKSGSEASAPQAQAHTAPPPANSPLAKVQVGMSEREVQNLLGPPTDENAYVTGKAFIPWYFGRDRHRIAYFYKGTGRVVFAGGGGMSMTGKVSRIEYDPNEPGRAR